MVRSAVALALLLGVSTDSAAPKRLAQGNQNGQGNQTGQGNQNGNGNQNEYGYDTTTIDIVYNVEGVGEITDTLQNWANWCNSQKVPSIEEKLGKFADYTYDTRLQFATAVEGAFMNWYPCSSIYYRNTASMNSQKVNTVVDTYVTLIGFGGIQRWLKPVKGAASMPMLLNHLYDYETSGEPSDFVEAAERVLASLQTIIAIVQDKPFLPH